MEFAYSNKSRNLIQREIGVHILPDIADCFLNIFVSLMVSPSNGSVVSAKVLQQRKNRMADIQYRTKVLWNTMIISIRYCIKQLAQVVIPYSGLKNQLSNWDSVFYTEPVIDDQAPIPDKTMAAYAVGCVRVHNEDISRLKISGRSATPYKAVALNAV